jgi:hypothetical protein
MNRAGSGTTAWQKAKYLYFQAVKTGFKMQTIILKLNETRYFDPF